MRTVGTGNSAQPTSGFGPDAITAVTVEVANASDVLVDLSAYAVSVEYDSSADEIVDAATVVFRRLEGASSLAPLMTASPPVDLGRRIVITVDVGADLKQVFSGKITDVDWPERFGDVTCQCLDQARDASRTWIEDAIEYGSTTGVSLETVMQAVSNDNMTTPPTLYFPAATSAVVQHVEGDPPYGPTEQSVLDAERALAESYGGTIRWRNFDASLDDWKWTVFTPSRTKTVPDHTFGTSDYFDVKQIKQSDADIRNVIEVEYIGEGGAKESVTVSDAASIAAYGRLYAKISEGSDSPVNNSTLATNLANAALSDLKEPDVLLEIACRYFWPGEIGVDLYRFTANSVHFSSDQDLAPMQFRHRIAVGESPTTHIMVRGKPSGGVLSWRRRVISAEGLKPLFNVPALQITGFREVARTATTATLGWNVSGSVHEIWGFSTTVAQPVSTDPWPSLTGVPTFRLTAATTEYTVNIPATGYVTYVRIVPISADAVRGTFWDLTVQPNTPSQLLQRARAFSTSATQVVVRVAVADPHPSDAVDVSVAYTATGCTVTETSPQTILAAAITSDIDTTGTKDFTVTRPAFGSGTGRVAFTASASGRLSDVDAVDIPAVERDTVFLAMRARVTASTATTATVRVAVADPIVATDPQTVTIAYTETGGTGTAASPVSGGTVTPAATLTEAAGTYIDYTVTRPNFGTGTRRITFTATAAGRTSDSDAVDIPAVEQDTDTVYSECRAAVTSVAATTVTVTVTGVATTGTPTVHLVAITGSATLNSGPAVGATGQASGTVWVFNRGAFQSGVGQVQFRATLSGTQTDDDFVEIPTLDRDTQPVQVRITRVSESGSDMVVRVAAITPNAGATCTVAYDAGGLTVSPASGGTFTSTTDFATTAYIDYTITKPAYTSTQRRVAFTVSATGFVSGASGVDVPPMGRDLSVNKLTASEISVTNLAAINADLGTVTSGYIQNSGNTAAIRLSGTTTLPTTNYLDFTATGASLFLKNAGLEITADGKVTAKVVKLSGDGTSPTIATGLSTSRIGTGYTLTVTGKDTAGTITLTTGTGITTAVSLGTSMFVVTFGTAYAANPHGVVSSRNRFAADLAAAVGGAYFIDPITTDFSLICSKDVTFVDSTTYKWSWAVIG